MCVCVCDGHGRSGIGDGDHVYVRIAFSCKKKKKKKMFFFSSTAFTVVVRLTFFYGYGLHPPCTHIPMSSLLPSLQFASCTISFEKREKNAVIICFMALGVHFFFCYSFFSVILRSLRSFCCCCIELWAWVAWCVMFFFFFFAFRFISNKTSGNRVWKENLYVKRTSVCHFVRHATVATKFIWYVCCVSSAFRAIPVSNSFYFHQTRASVPLPLILILSHTYTCASTHIHSLTGFSFAYELWHLKVNCVFASYCLSFAVCSCALHLVLHSTHNDHISWHE